MQELSWTLTQRFADQLSHFDAWFDKAAAHADQKRYDVNGLLTVRLAPDMFPLARQIGSACDTAKLAAARLSGKTAPVHKDDQVSFDLFRVRIAECVSFIRSTKREDYANAEDVWVSFPWYPGKKLPARAYLLQYALPNFHFHYTTTYAILRNNGVDLGKSDYLGALPWQDV
jgi:uncharacterized protein